MLKQCSIAKRFMLIFMLIIISMSFCGCAEIRAMTTVNEDKTIDQCVYVTLKENEIRNAGYNLALVKKDVSDEAFAEAVDIKQQFINNINMQIMSYQLSGDLETVNTLQSFANGLSIIGNKWTDNKYGIGLRFANSDVYRYFYGITTDNTDNRQYEKHFFYTKVIDTGSTLYLRYQSLYDSISSKFEIKYPNLINTESELLFTYVADTHREHSDADFITKQNGKYYHTWKVEPSDFEKEVVLYYNIANQGNCILVCLITGLGICVVLLVCGIFAVKIKKQRKTINKISLS